MNGAAVAAMIAWLAAAGGPSGAENAATADELSRVRGHTVRVGPDGALDIVDVAGEGRPLIGVVERRDDALILRAGDERLILRGPLAIPRIAGPGYKVWVLGERRGGVVRVHRLGVLRRPPR